MDEALRAKRLGAGEGGRLPRGLSLFRFFLFSGLMLGAVYGGASLYFASPPVPGYIPAEGVSSAQWSPSPLWLPGFLSIHGKLGVAWTPAGYAFRGSLGRALFGMSTIAMGILLGGVVGWIVGERVRRYVLKIKHREGGTLGA
jgi:hypothetical protein